MNKYKLQIKLLNDIIKDARVNIREKNISEATKGADRYMIDYLQCWKDVLKDEEDGWRETDIKDSINEVIKHLQEGYISDEHRHSELNWDCIECRARILEGGLEWLKDDEEEDDIDDDDNHL